MTRADSLLKEVPLPECSASPRQMTMAQPDEIIQVAGQTANTIVATAQATALEVLRSARAAAQAITRSIDVVIVIDGQPTAGGNSCASDRQLITLQRTARAAPR